MNRLFSLLLLLCSSLAYAQQSPFLLNRLPYRTTQTSIPRLDANDALSVLTPLPDFNIPQQLPIEFSSDAKLRESIRLFTQANQQLIEGNSEAATDLIRQALELNPSEIAIQVALADSLYATGLLVEAKQIYTKVLEQVPFHFQSLNNLGWLLATAEDPSIQDPTRALLLAQRARLIRPNSHHVWSTISQAQYELGKYAEAQNAIQNAMQIGQRIGVNVNVFAQYMLQLDRCRLAREATSLLQ